MGNFISFSFIFIVVHDYSRTYSSHSGYKFFSVNIPLNFVTNHQTWSLAFLQNLYVRSGASPKTFWLLLLLTLKFRVYFRVHFDVTYQKTFSLKFSLVTFDAQWKLLNGFFIEIFISYFWCPMKVPKWLFHWNLN